MTMIISGGGGPAPASEWTQPNASIVNDYIREAQNHSHGNIEQAFVYLRDQRDQPQNYYNTNLAIAADYFRAYWDSQTHGPDAERLSVAAYLELKKEGLAPKEGPGPVSPYSNLEAQYMNKGISDEENHTPLWERIAWDLPIPGPVPVPVGVAKNLIDDVLNFL
jgi:hypothetical protein